MTTLQQIINQTETLNQHDFLNYVYRLQEIAQKKYSLSIFLHDFKKSSVNYTEKREILSFEKQNSILGLFPEGTFVMSDDFDAPLDEFKDYM